MRRGMWGADGLTGGRAYSTPFHRAPTIAPLPSRAILVHLWLKSTFASANKRLFLPIITSGKYVFHASFVARYLDRQGHACYSSNTIVEKI
jgi:hypothetical protein